MNNRTRTVVFVLVAAFCLAAVGAVVRGESPADMHACFQAPPESARPWVYWFWMNGNITRAGITADLEAMHQVGIGGCLIMHVKLGDIGEYKLGQMPPDGPVEFMSDDFRQLFRHAVAEADRLGMAIDMNNADGFTGSGGPWVPVEKSMKKLVWKTVPLHGGTRQSIELPQPVSVLGYYRDVAVVAYPRQPSLYQQMKAAQPTFAAPDDKFNRQYVCDQKPQTVGIVWRRGVVAKPQLVISFTEPYCADTLVLRNTRIGRSVPIATLETSDDGTHFRPVGKISLKWYPAAPTNTIRFDATTARYFRLSFARSNTSISVGDVALGRSNKVHYWEPKGGFTRYGEWGGGSQWYTDRKTTAQGAAVSKMAPVSRDGVPPIAAAKVIDLTGSVGKDGRLTWDVPAGDWTVLRIGCTSTGIKNHPASRGGHGLECDKLDRSGVDVAFNGMLQKLIADTGDFAGNSFRLAHVDSWEVGIQNWTEAMAAEFKRRNGYDLTRFYPLLVAGHAVESNEVSERFLWDLRRTLLAMIGENYLGRMQSLCHENGLKFSSEAGGRQQFLYNPIYLLAKSDLPMGEFWPHEKTPRVDGKAAASVAHLYDKPRVGAESFTGALTFANWQAHPYRLKQIGDDAFCLGVNQFVIHYSVHQAYANFRPGFAMGPWGIHLDRMNTWWPQAKPWLTYLARCQYLLRQGHFVADVLYFPGEDVPHFFGKRDKLSVPLPAGYDFDGCDRATLLDRLIVKNGRLALPNGMRYRYLMLPDQQTMTPAVAGRLRQLVEQGATVIGPPATRSPSLRGFPDCDRQVTESLKSLAKNGRFVWGKTFEQIAGEDGVFPDFAFLSAATNADLRYIHRRTKETEIYFVANHEDQPVDVLAAFRVDGKQPEFWDPETGRLLLTGMFGVRDARTWLPMHLGPLQSVFVVFRDRPVNRHIVEVSRNGRCVYAVPATSGQMATPVSEAVPMAVVNPINRNRLDLRFTQSGDYAFRFSDDSEQVVHVGTIPRSKTLAGQWTVGFPKGSGAPDSVQLDQLISWTEHSDFGVRHFSGTATYRNTFSWKPDPNGASVRQFLHLGDVQVMADVTLNGHALSLLWKPPFCWDVTDCLKAGKNQLEVHVTNLWPNRLIGDEQFPNDAQLEGKYLKVWPDWFLKKRLRPEPRRKAFSVVKHYGRDSPLLPSGLLGPVVLRSQVERRFSPSN